MFFQLWRRVNDALILMENARQMGKIRMETDYQWNNLPLIFVHDVNNHSIHSSSFVYFLLYPLSIVATVVHIHFHFFCVKLVVHVLGADSPLVGGLGYSNAVFTMGGMATVLIEVLVVFCSFGVKILQVFL